MSATFAFKPGDLVLVKWNDSMVYFAKVKKIDQRRKKCVVVFDDKSHDEADFDQIHSVDETTTDIICIKCKRDDSDAPNEIVLCDRCGIGYHQKCHVPPIPASALELDTPWNCAYCLRGVKCPYLTESLDVLQNLLSDEETQSHDDMDSVMTVDSDEGGEEFTAPAVPQEKFLTPPRPHKKRGRKPKVKRGPKPKDRAKSPGAEPVQCVKEGSQSSGMVTTTESPSSELAHSPSLSHAESSAQLKRKRSQFAAVAVRKRPRKSSVQSQTLSVTRISVPVHGDSISPKSEIPEEDEKEASHSPAKLTKSDTIMFSSPDRSPPIIAARRGQTETLAQLQHKKPRSLRVSLSLPEEVEPGSPLEKVVKNQKLLSPKFVVTQSLPLWDDDPKAPPVLSVSSSENTPTQSPKSKHQSGNLSQHKQGSVEAQSPTSASEGPLTPFTASALPLQAIAGNSENGDRKRKRADQEDASDTSLPLKKVNLTLTSPETPPEDVFTNSSVKSGPGTTTTMGQTSLTPAVQSQSPETSGYLPSPALKHAPSSELAGSDDILSGTASPPVGYGADPPSDKQPTPTIGPPTVIMVQPTPKDKEVEITPKTSSFLTSTADLTTSVPITVVKEPTTKTLAPQSAKPALSLQCTGPEKQTAVPKSPTTDRSRQLIQPSASSSEKATTSHPDSAGVGGTPVSAVKTQVSQPLPQSIIQSPSVIKSTLRNAVPTTSSVTSQARSSSVPLDNGARQLPKSTHAVRGSSMAVQTTPTQSIPNPVKNAASTKVDDLSSNQPHRQLTGGISVSTSTVTNTNPPLPQSNATVSVITSPPSSASSETLPILPTPRVGSRKPPSVTDQDIIITSVEKRPPSSVNITTAHPLPSYSEAVHSKSTNSTKTVITPTSAASHTPSTKARPQSFFGKQGMRVATKIAEIEPGPMAMSQVRSAPHQRSGSQQYTPSQQTRAVIMPPTSQTPVPVVSLVATPTAYATQPATHTHGSTAFTIIPAEAVVQSRQGGVTIAMPPVKAVPPGGVSLDTTAVVVQQPSQRAAAVKCIIEPMVPAASTSVVYSQTASIPAAVTGSQAINTSSAKALSSPVYRTQVVSGKSMPVATTKPYAIVPAQPTESVEIQGIAVDKRGTPVISTQVPVGYSVVPVQATVTPTVGAKQVAYPAEKMHSSGNISQSKFPTFASVSSRILPSTKNNGHAASLDKIERTPDEQTAANLDDVGKRIRDAFANHSEAMLIAAFEDAWKKFQDNGKRYPSTAKKMGHPETTTTSGKPVVPPNAEVVSVPGTSSRLSLIRPTYSRSKISVPKSSPDRIVRETNTQPSPCVVPPQQSQQKQQQVQYLYYTDGSSQPQVFAVSSDYSGTTALYAVPPINAQPSHTQQLVKQAQPQGASSQKMYQVQTSGIYVPARATGMTLGSNKPAAVVMEMEQVIGGGNKAVVQAPRNQIALTEKAVAVQQAPEQVPAAAVQHLSVLRKTLPVIENGAGYGNSVIKRKSVASPASKAIRLCALCTKEATYLCSGCRRIWYCGKDCQLKAWDEHSETCKS